MFTFFIDYKLIILYNLNGDNNEYIYAYRCK